MEDIHIINTNQQLQKYKLSIWFRNKLWKIEINVMYKRSSCVLIALYCQWLLLSLPKFEWVHLKRTFLDFLFIPYLSGYYLGGIITLAKRKKPPQIASTSSTFTHLYVWFRFTPIVQRDHARWYHCDFKFYVLFIHLVNGKNSLSFSYLSEFIVTNCKLLALYLKYYIYFIA